MKFPFPGNFEISPFQSNWNEKEIVQKLRSSLKGDLPVPDHPQL